ncbi:hypothetical protein [Desulforamulus ruminis]|uniref:hypothetical protein n=1 Tax=Desulforamulus ruminis TaxID=1564 RepID=UPI002353C77A|nr:hypothetical protein [Desulforamulus ruminis]
MAKESKAKPAGYTKQQFLASKSFTPQQKDVLNAVLEDGKLYTREEVTRLVEEFAKRKVE